MYLITIITLLNCLNSFSYNQHHHERLGKYRLEDEELTHLGQSLGEIDKFDDVHLSDDDDNDNNEDGGKMEMFSVLTNYNIGTDLHSVY